jgi:hypothetical protein
MVAAGAPMSRFTLHNQDWTPEEEHYLLENAGILTLPKIAAHLNRSRGACRARLSKTFEITARDNHGYLSASQLAKEFNCPCHRIRKALKAGKIKGFFDPVRNRWNVDLTSLTAGALEILTKPKDTWTNHVTDVGDYYSRHGLIRKVIRRKDNPGQGVFACVNSLMQMAHAILYLRASAAMSTRDDALSEMRGRTRNTSSQEHTHCVKRRTQLRCY